MQAEVKTKIPATDLTKEAPVGSLIWPEPLIETLTYDIPQGSDISQIQLQHPANRAPVDKIELKTKSGMTLLITRCLCQVCIDARLRIGKQISDKLKRAAQRKAKRQRQKARPKSS